MKELISDTRTQNTHYKLNSINCIAARLTLCSVFFEHLHFSYQSSVDLCVLTIFSLERGRFHSSSKGNYSKGALMIVRNVHTYFLIGEGEETAHRPDHHVPSVLTVLRPTLQNKVSLFSHVKEMKLIECANVERHCCYMFTSSASQNTDPVVHLLQKICVKLLPHKQQLPLARSILSQHRDREQLSHRYGQARLPASHSTRINAIILFIIIIIIIIVFGRRDGDKQCSTTQGTSTH